MLLYAHEEGDGDKPPPPPPDSDEIGQFIYKKIGLRNSQANDYCVFNITDQFDVKTDS